MSVIEALSCVSLWRRVWIDRRGEIADEGDLSCRVDTTEVVGTICTQVVSSVKCDDGVSGEQTDDTEQENEQTADVHQTSRSEDCSTVITL